MTTRCVMFSILQAIYSAEVLWSLPESGENLTMYEVLEISFYHLGNLATTVLYGIY